MLVLERLHYSLRERVSDPGAGLLPFQQDYRGGGHAFAAAERTQTFGIRRLEVYARAVDTNRRGQPRLHCWKVWSELRPLRENRKVCIRQGPL